MKFPEHLKAARKEKGLTQTQVAEHLGVNQSTIASWEIGRRQPRTAQDCVALKELLGIPLQVSRPDWFEAVA